MNSPSVKIGYSFFPPNSYYWVRAIGMVSIPPNPPVMISKDIKYSYRDVCIKPALISSVDHRAECNPYYSEGQVLPLFTAPMDSVVGLGNFDLWGKYGIQAILPRTVDIGERLSFPSESWVAYSLQEFEDHFCKGNITNEPRHALIDVANGHMKKLYDLVQTAKSLNPSITVMVGNVANPETYRIAAQAGVDYLRVGIGSGRGCITSTQTSVHMPMASLLDEMVQIKRSIPFAKTKIIADGGVRGYSDIIKALALGADYVMIGSVFTKMLESAAPIKGGMTGPFDYKDGKFYVKGEEVLLEKEFYGMASKEGQIAIGGKKTKTAEGIKVILPVEYTMSSWVGNFIDYLRSAMSYTNARTLEEFQHNTEIITCSIGAIGSINV